MRDIKFEKNIYKYFLVLAILVITFCYEFSFGIYGSIDNHLIATVVNGLYGNNYDIFVNPILSGIIAFLSSVYSGIDYFTVILWLIIFFSFATFSIYVIKNRGIIISWILICYVWIMFFLLAGGMRSQFTILSAFEACVGLFLLIDGYCKNSFESYFGVMFISFGIMIRMEATLLIIPYLFLYFLFNEGKIRKKLIFFAFLCWGFMILLQVIYNCGLYKEEYEYNKVRSSIQDYPVKEYSEVKWADDYVINQNDYNCIVNWMNMDSFIMDTDYLDSFHKQTKMFKYQLNIKGVVRFIKDYISVAIINNKKLGVLYLFTLIIAIYLLVVSRSNKVKIQLLLNLVGTLFIVSGFLFIGRAPDKIHFSCLFYSNSLLLISVGEIIKPRLEKVILWSLIVFTFILGTKALMKNTNLNYGEVELWWEWTYDDGALYFWHPYTYNAFPMKDYMENNKLPNREFLEHNIVIGGSRINQFYYNDFLKQINVTNMIEKMVFDDNSFFVGDEYAYECMYNYINDHYYENVNATLIKQNEKYGIWKFYSINYQ